MRKGVSFREGIQTLLDTSEKKRINQQVLWAHRSNQETLSANGRSTCHSRNTSVTGHPQTQGLFGKRSFKARNLTTEKLSW